MTVFILRRKPGDHNTRILLPCFNSLRPSDAYMRRRQAIICTNDGILLIGASGTNFSKILIEIQTFSFWQKSFESVCEMAAILSRPQCFKSSHYIRLKDRTQTIGPCAMCFIDIWAIFFVSIHQNTVCKISVNLFYCQFAQDGCDGRTHWIKAGNLREFLLECESILFYWRKCSVGFNGDFLWSRQYSIIQATEKFKNQSYCHFLCWACFEEIHVRLHLFSLYNT